MFIHLLCYALKWQRLLLLCSQLLVHRLSDVGTKVWRRRKAVGWNIHLREHMRGGEVRRGGKERIKTAKWVWRMESREISLNISPQRTIKCPCNGISAISTSCYNAHNSHTHSAEHSARQKTGGDLRYSLYYVATSEVQRSSSSVW